MYKQNELVLSKSYVYGFNMNIDILCMDNDINNTISSENNISSNIENNNIYVGMCY